MTKFEQALRATFERTAGDDNVTTALQLIRGKINPIDVSPSASRLESMSYHPQDKHTLVMVAVNELLGTCGVEYIGDVDMYDGPPVEYLNTGDPYAATLVWYRDRARPWAVESWEDVAERLGL